MQLLKMNVNGQVTIPREVREKLHCQIGDYFQVQIEKNGLRLFPARIIDPTQDWFWTKEWQQKEKTAEEDLEKDQYSTFKNTKDALKHLKDLSK